MKLRAFGILTNENVHPQVAEWLMSRGFDVLTTFQAQLVGAADRDVLRRARAENRTVLTHDADFGRLAVAEGEPICGILYVRPGHVDAAYTIDSLTALLATDPDVAPPFILALRRSTGRLTIRVRTLS